MSSFVISVSAGTGCYRHIQISKSETLYRLHKAIIQAFDFDDDHEHAFFMDNKCGSKNAPFFSRRLDRTDKLTKNVKLNELGLKKGDQFKYLFDYGDEWIFQCKMLREVDAPTDIPGVIRSVGESPEQYPDYDGFGDDEDYEALTEEEIDELFEQIPLSRDIIDRIHMYMDAAARLYGLISLDKLLDVYNSQNPPVEPALFYAVASVVDCMDNDYFVVDHEDLPHVTPEEKLAASELIADYLFVEDPEGNIQHLREMQADKPLKILSKKQFLRFCDPLYFPSTPQRTAMAEFLKYWEHKLPLSAWDYCSCIQELIVVDAPMQTIMDFIEEDDLSFDGPGVFEKFFTLIMDLNNHTHKHSNNGNTPDELFSANIQSLPHAARKVPDAQMSIFDPEYSAPASVPTAKISRNAPCPCGSGKKYKNCCGR